MKASRWILTIGLVLLGGLAILSVRGAFLGAERASRFFNAPPMALFWLILAGSLVAGVVWFRRLWTQPFLFLIHAGCILVLIGALWGSRQRIDWQNRLFGTHTFPEGVIPLYVGQGSSVLYDKQGRTAGELPFEIHLLDFQVQYYDRPQFVVQDKTDPQRIYSIPVEPDQTLTFGEEDHTFEFRIMRSFHNLQIQREEGRTKAVEGPPEGDNPAFEVRITLPDGSEETQYVFRRFPVHSLTRYRFEIQYQTGQIPKEYISDLAVIASGQEKARKRIEVNHPLTYQGYLFHQLSWGRDANGVYSVIGVVSNSGLAAVFAGYGLLAAGVFGHFWILPAAGRTRRKGAA